MFSYDVYFHEEENDQAIHEYGIVSAPSYGAAANRLVEYFGKESIISIELTELMDVLAADEIRDMF